MIKLKKIYEAIHVELPKGPQKSKEDDFVTIPTGQEPETGKKSWDVVYTTGAKSTKRIMFSKTYQALKKLADEFEYVATLPTYKEDGEIHTFAKTLRTLEQKFKEYIYKKGRGNV